MLSLCQLQKSKEVLIPTFLPLLSCRCSPCRAGEAVHPEVAAVLRPLRFCLRPTERSEMEGGKEGGTERDGGVHHPQQERDHGAHLPRSGSHGQYLNTFNYTLWFVSDKVIKPSSQSLIFIYFELSNWAFWFCFQSSDLIHVYMLTIRNECSISVLLCKCKLFLSRPKCLHGPAKTTFSSVSWCIKQNSFVFLLCIKNIIPIIPVSYKWRLLLI